MPLPLPGAGCSATGSTKTKVPKISMILRQRLSEWQARGNNGVFFHIGDGAAIAFSGGYGEDFTASRPENGRFSCETYFYTMDDWKDNLRFTPFENAQTVFLMSDGVTNFAFSRDFNRIERGFLYPINDYLESETSKSRAARALVNTLNTPQARKLNNDDKTLFWAKLS